MEKRESTLTAFLAGDLDEETSRRFDEHLLACDRYWRAVRENRRGRAAAAPLREQAPAGLADRVQFTVDLQAQDTRRLPWRRLLTGGGVLAVAITALITLLLAIPPAEAPPIIEVVHVAQSVPAPVAGTAGSPSAGPVLVAQPATVQAGTHTCFFASTRLAGCGSW